MGYNPRLSRRQFIGCVGGGVASGYLLGCNEASISLSEQHNSESRVAANEWDDLAEAALKRVRAAGAEYGDIRIIDVFSQGLSGEDRRIEDITDTHDRGFGVRVLYHGAWGFAASSIVTPEEVGRIADRAVEIAKGSATLVTDPVRLVPEPVHRDSFVSPRREDPFAVPLEEKARLLVETMDLLHKQAGIQRSSASLGMRRDLKLFASTEGARIHFDLLMTHGGFGATAVHEGRFASRGFNATPLRAGYELIRDAHFLAEAPRVAAEAAEKVRSPVVEPGPYDLILDPENLSLTIHETCGHASELDRALGYEANYAGTSFLTTDKLGKFRYGSPHVNLVADNTEPGGLASTGYDDDGVEAQRWPIVREGLFVGYSTSREVAGKIGQTRSRGSNRAEDWASIPIVRIANVGLAPGRGRLNDMIADVKRGIYIEGDGSWSIDQRRYNFQFGGDAFWLIENGKRKGMLRDVIYHGITPEFWASCDAVADASHRRRYGAMDCIKGQPDQAACMTHAASHARFRRINVIRGESAR